MFLAFAGAAACTDGGQRGVHARDAWLRPTPPGVTSAALYVHIDNDTDTADLLIDASAEPCLVLTVHITITDANGTSAMSEPGGHVTELPAGGALDLVPEGLHLMCYGLARELRRGEAFDVTLHFREAGDVVVRAVVADR